MGYFQVKYDSRVVIYDRRAFIRLATEDQGSNHSIHNFDIDFLHIVNSTERTKRNKKSPVMDDFNTRV